MLSWQASSFHFHPYGVWSLGLTFIGQLLYCCWVSHSPSNYPITSFEFAHIICMYPYLAIYLLTNYAIHKSGPFSTFFFFFWFWNNYRTLSYLAIFSFGIFLPPGIPFNSHYLFPSLSQAMFFISLRKFFQNMWLLPRLAMYVCTYVQVICEPASAPATY